MSDQTKSRTTGRRRRTTRRLSKRPIRVPGDDVPRAGQPGPSDSDRLELEGIDVDIDSEFDSEPADGAPGDADDGDLGHDDDEAADDASESAPEPAASADSAGAPALEREPEHTEPRPGTLADYEPFESLRAPASREPEPAHAAPAPALVEPEPEPEEAEKTDPKISAEAVTRREPEPEEKTQPRVDLEQLRRRALEDDVTTNPRIDLRALQPGQMERTSTLIVSRARVISDMAPPNAEPVAAEPPGAQRGPTPERPLSWRPPPAPSVPPPVPEDSDDLVLEDLDDARPARTSRTPPPPPHESAVPAPKRSEAAVPSLLPDASIPPAPAKRPSLEAPAPPPTRKAPEAPPAPMAAKRPPPPPAEPRAPPPPPTEQKPKKPRQRQWFERFFSDDYLMTVLPPTRQQVARQVDFLEASLGIERGATVLDVGCGLGTQALELSRRGMLVVGLDLSLPMITRAAEEAQQNGLKINFLHTDIREIEFEGTFDAVICLGTTFGFFDDDSNRDVLARLHNALRPGGRLLLDVVNRDFVLTSQPNLVWFQGDECVCMEESDFNYFSSRLVVKRTMMREDGTQSDAEYSIRLYALHEIGKLMQQVGFRVMEVSGHEVTRGVFFGAHSQRLIILAERRAAQSQTHERPALSVDGRGEG
jgi:SAM-dependent methyltransferase